MKEENQRFFIQNIERFVRNEM